MKKYIDFIDNISPKILADMANTEQDKEWHAEGDVLTHSKMVFNALKEVEEYNELPKREKEILCFAALLHDMGKPLCTKEEDGRITSRGHSRIGAKYFRELFFDAFIGETREEIANLIRLHGYPIFYFEKKEWDIVKTAEAVNLKYLYILAKADVLGRISNDKDEYLYNVEYFKEKAIEYGVFGQRREFENWLHREFFFKNGYDYTPFSKKVSKIIMMCGLPGVGKSFYLSDMNIPVISLDEIRKKMKIPHGSKKIGRVIQEAKRRAKVYLAKGEDFAWDATNLNRENRAKLISMFFKEYGAFVKIVYIEKRLDTIFKLNANRANSVPKQTILGYLKKLEVPTADEADEVVYNY